jgi:hypothetical protein
MLPVSERGALYLRASSGQFVRGAWNITLAAAGSVAV